MAKTILVTGGAGYIGSHTVVELLEAKYNVVVIDNLYNSSIGAIQAIKNITGKDLIFYKGDCADSDFVKSVFAKNSIDAVIHFAGYKAVGESVEKPLFYYGNNLGSTVTLLEVMKEFSCTKFVFSSSATVYLDPKDVKYNETTTQTNRPFSPYGSTKLVQEYILEDVAKGSEFEKVDGLQVVSLRYFNPIGAHFSGDLGEDPNGIPNNLAPYITQVAVGKLKELQIFGDDYKTPDGTCLRDYIHVVDLAKGHLSGLEYIFAKKGKFFDPINLGTGAPVSVFQVVESFVKAVGRPIPYKVVGRRSGDLPEFYADPEKAKKVLGWQTKLDLDKMTADSWHWQKRHPNGFES
ncbi:MAG: UDP-glucose 4-epimerase GalE [Bifidobacteriaceae bacterium]|jgi:UDP-glucose 4-epimerase|nr:UDP-glucose 4-epimerase GalE [Bifidobacteriaceae bacterium]